MTLWKSFVLYRYVTGVSLALLVAKIFLYYSIVSPVQKYLNPMEDLSKCIYGESRLLNPEWNANFDEVSFYILLYGHGIAIFSCVYIDILWLGIVAYKIMFMLTIGFTLGQSMSGYMEKCSNQFTLFFVDHFGMIICLFNLHMLFIYTHRGITFYQWIPLKIRELFQYIRKLYLSLTDKNRNPEDHLIQNITGIEYTKRKYEKIPLLEEDQEEFEQLIEKTSWKSYAVYRFVTGASLVYLFAKTFVYYTTEAPMLISVSTNPFLTANRDVSQGCTYPISRWWSASWDSEIDHIAFYSIGIAHSISIVACIYIDLLWLGIVSYHIMFILTLFMTLGQGMSGYMENCPNLFTLFCVIHFGMVLCLFNLHILFIYTHRGLTLYQWIPLKIRELFQYIRKLYLLLTDKNRNPEDHLIQNITGIEYTKRKYEKIPLLEEDQEEFEQLIEKTCVEE